ncbi:Uncharacterised protein [Neisseria meningitidis]|nr:Uncharacterised protein [Neisseria meningitidis]
MYCLRLAALSYYCLRLLLVLIFVNPLYKALQPFQTAFVVRYAV